MVKKKLVFQDVDTQNKPSPKLQTEFVSKDVLTLNRPSVLWLSSLLLMIAMIVIVGGMTRLTDSGLSIVEWKPISGVLFPLTNEHWLAEFEKYKSIPEFFLINSDMAIEEFKYIYFWEWGHRQLGRLIGLTWFVGFGWLVLKRIIPEGWTLKFLLIGFLIGFQGFIGWWMVYSGLMPEMTDVASYRLAIHLGMAFSIVGLILWFILSLRLTIESAMLSRRYRDKKLLQLMNIYLIALFLQIILGALVAGIDAGTAYTDWPYMAGELFPTDYWSFDGVLKNLLENSATVQFNHRLSAYLLVGLGLLIFIQSRRNSINFLKKWHGALFFALFVQIIVGIVTVIYGAPYQIAIVHQFLALCLWLFAIWLRFETAFPRRQILT